MFYKVSNKPDFDKTPIHVHFKTVEYDISTILQKIDQIDDLDNSEIKDIIVTQYRTILNYDLFLSVPETRNAALKLFTNQKFLAAFFEVAGLIKFSDDQIICINKLAYDYYILPDKDMATAILLLDICTVVNSTLTIKLSAYIEYKQASILAMISNSSFRIEKRIHRVNTFLTRYEPHISNKSMADVYLVIFGRIGDLFINTMLESWQGSTNIEPSEEGTYEQLQLYRFNQITATMRLLVSSMISSDITALLTNYAYTLLLVRKGTPLRCSVKELFAADRRITHLIEEVETNTELTIP